MWRRISEADSNMEVNSGGVLNMEANFGGGFQYGGGFFLNGDVFVSNSVNLYRRSSPRGDPHNAF